MILMILLILQVEINYVRFFMKDYQMKKLEKYFELWFDVKYIFYLSCNRK
jgi:hypothetical protein